MPWNFILNQQERKDGVLTGSNNFLSGCPWPEGAIKILLPSARPEEILPGSERLSISSYFVPINRNIQSVTFIFRKADLLQACFKLDLVFTGIVAIPITLSQETRPASETMRTSGNLHASARMEGARHNRKG